MTHSFQPRLSNEDKKPEASDGELKTDSTTKLVSPVEEKKPHNGTPKQVRQRKNFLIIRGIS